MDMFTNTCKRIGRYVTSRKQVLQQKLADRRQNETQFNILLIGETGAGKSTFVNYLVNFFNGADLDQLKVAIPNKYFKSTEKYGMTEKNLNDASQSKTADCTTYQLSIGDLNFCVVDTPGLSDTGGPHKDDENIVKILRAAENTKKLAAIVVVINGSACRATASLTNALTRMKGSIPDALLKNILFVFTNCNEVSCNFDPDSLMPWIVKADNGFHMNNSIFSADPAKWRNCTKFCKYLSEGWKESMYVIENFIERVTELAQTGTTDFKIMRQRRDQIKSEVHDVLLEIKKLQNLQSMLESMEAVGESIEANVQKYSKYKRTTVMDYTEMVVIEYHNTLCSIHTDVICHEHCGLRETETPGDKLFKDCICMGHSDNCQVCKCGHEQHYHARRKMVKKQKNVENILKDVKMNYDIYRGRQRAHKEKVRGVQYDVDLLKRVLKDKDKRIQECCLKVKQVCSNFNFVAELKSVIDVMEANASTLKPTDARGQADQMIRGIKALVDRLTSGNEPITSKDLDSESDIYTSDEDE